MRPPRWDVDDTIAALASAPGPGGRAIVRLSGPVAFYVVNQLFSASRGALAPGYSTPALTPLGSSGRTILQGHLHLPGLPTLPADVYLWPGPASYTGQDVAELHTLSCQPLVDVLVSELLKTGARAARPGEFTLRAFLAGKLDLTRAEAVLGVIEAADRDELKHALKQLAGGVGQPLQLLREDLLNLVADVEAALDFADEDLSFVDQKQLLFRVGKGLAMLMTVQKQLHNRAMARRPFRAVLAGRPNAGKSTLFNALTGASALVSPEPGTTRDYLLGTVAVDGIAVELVDTAGWRDATDAIELQSQHLGRAQGDSADLVLWCTAPGDEAAVGGRNVITVATKCDLSPAPQGHLATSAVTGEGLQELRCLLADGARHRKQPALAPSLSRCAHHVAACIANLRRAHALVLEEDPPELLALELREALEQLGAMVGAIYTEDLLDRIFSRFCVGK